MHPLSSTAMMGRSHLRIPATVVAGFEDLLGICSDDHVREKRRGTDRFINPANQRLSRNLAEHFARQAGGDEPSRNHGNGFHPTLVSSFLPTLASFEPDKWNSDLPCRSRFDTVFEHSWSHDWPPFVSLQPLSPALVRVK